MVVHEYLFSFWMKEQSGLKKPSWTKKSPLEPQLLNSSAIVGHHKKYNTNCCKKYKESIKVNFSSHFPQELPFPWKARLFFSHLIFHNTVKKPICHRILYLSSESKEATIPLSGVGHSQSQPKQLVMTEKKT